MVVCGDINAKSETRRVPCPYDPSHSVYLHRLKAHMEKLCNARPPATRPAHTVPDCNVALLPPGYAEGSFSECGQLWAEEGLAKADTRLMVQPGEHAYLGTTNSKLFGDLRTSAQDNLLSATAAPLTEATTHRLLRPVVSSYLRSLSAAPDNIEEMGLVELLDLVRPTEDLPLDICTHSALDERRLLKTNAKHVLQQASLLGHLDKRGLLDAKYAFIEFGAGKGELS
ncbi:tRNA:m4X modification enzyme, partial [Coemansia thaxteri]